MNFVRTWAEYRKDGGQLNIKAFAQRWNELRKEKELNDSVAQNVEE